jgi:hypothetical protein
MTVLKYNKISDDELERLLELNAPILFEPSENILRSEINFEYFQTCRLKYTFDPTTNQIRILFDPNVSEQVGSFYEFLHKF